MRNLIAIPMALREANEFIRQFHRHSDPVVGCRFAIGASTGDELVGVAVVGNPVARLLNGGYTAEVTRCCVVPHAPKGACSFLYSRCWRAWSAMGGLRLITYTLASESGASLRGGGFRNVASVPPGSWSRSGRERRWKPICGQRKFRWEISA